MLVNMSSLATLEVVRMTTFVAANDDVDGLAQERRNSSALAMELHLSCINPSIYSPTWRLCIVAMRYVLSHSDEIGIISQRLMWGFVCVIDILRDDTNMILKLGDPHDWN